MIFFIVTAYIVIFLWVLRQQHRRFQREERSNYQRPANLLPHYQEAYNRWKQRAYFEEKEGQYILDPADQDFRYFYTEWKDRINHDQQFFMAFMAALVQNETWLHQERKKGYNLDMLSFIRAFHCWLPKERYAELKDYPPQTGETTYTYAMRLVQLLFESTEVPVGLRYVWVNWQYPANLILYNWAKEAEKPSLISEMSPQDHILFQLYFYAAEGGDIRTFPDLPFKFSKRQVEWLRKMPARMTLGGGYWWMVYRGAGGEERLDTTIASLPLDFEHLRFWQDFVRMIAQEENMTLNSDQLWELVQMIQFIKFSKGSFLHHPEIEGHKGSQPNFKLKGVKLVKLYHELDILFCPRYPEPEGLPLVYPLTHAGGDYEIVWLDTRRALEEEGDVMEHCVGDYHWDCVNGESMIFSLRKKQEADKDWRELTIELGKGENGYHVNQALGKFNEAPTPLQATLLEEWLKANQINGIPSES